MACSREPVCPTDAVVWHSLMAAWMAVMLTWSLAGGHDTAALGRYDAVALVVFLAGTAWAVVRLAGRGGSAYVRLGVCCGAMVAMLVPATTAAATPRSTAVMSGMPGMAAPTTSTTTMGPSVVVTLLLVLALLAVVGSQMTALRARAAAHPLARGLEVATAGAMAVMLALAL